MGIGDWGHIFVIGFIISFILFYIVKMGSRRRHCAGREADARRKAQGRAGADGTGRSQSREDLQIHRRLSGSHHAALFHVLRRGTYDRPGPCDVRQGRRDHTGGMQACYGGGVSRAGTENGRHAAGRKDPPCGSGGGCGKLAVMDN